MDIFLCFVFLCEVSLMSCQSVEKNFEDVQESARTFFYEDHTVYFTMMVYFPFVTDSFKFKTPDFRALPSAVIREDALGAKDILVREEDGILNTVDGGKSIDAPELKIPAGTGARPVTSTTTSASSTEDPGEFQPSTEFQHSVGETDPDHNEIEDIHLNEVLTFKKRIGIVPEFDEEEIFQKPKSRQKRTAYIDDQPVNFFMCFSLPFIVPIVRYDQNLAQAHKNIKARKEFEKNLPNTPIHETEYSTKDHVDFHSDQVVKLDDAFAKRSFGTNKNEFGGRSISEHEESQPVHRSQYTETEFEPMTTAFDIGGKESHTQMWSPVNNYDDYDSIRGRSASGHQETSELLGSATLVSVDKRVIDVIESFPSNCTQRVLCRIGNSLAEASPLQAFLLHMYQANVFGYRDDEAGEALKVALDDEDCYENFDPCPEDLA